MEKFVLLRQKFVPNQLPKDNSSVVLPLFLMVLHAKDIWCSGAMKIYLCIIISVQNINCLWILRNHPIGKRFT